MILAWIIREQTDSLSMGNDGCDGTVMRPCDFRQIGKSSLQVSQILFESFGFFFRPWLIRFRGIHSTHRHYFSVCEDTDFNEFFRSFIAETPQHFRAGLYRIPLGIETPEPLGLRIGPILAAPGKIWRDFPGLYQLDPDRIGGPPL